MRIVGTIHLDLTRYIGPNNPRLVDPDRFERELREDIAIRRASGRDVIVVLAIRGYVRPPAAQYISVLAGADTVQFSGRPDVVTMWEDALLAATSEAAA